MYLHDLTSEEWCNLVFEGKNKEYGAYVLRRKAAKRYHRSMLIAGGIFLLFGLTLFVASKIVEQRLREAMKEVTAFAKMKSWEAEQDKTLKVIAAGRRVPKAKEPEPQETAVPEVTDEEVVEVFGGTGDKSAPLEAETAEAEAPNDTVYNADRTDLPDQGQLLTPTQVVEEMPQYPGGIEALVRFFDQEISYPPSLVRKKVTGDMEVSFYVDKEGNVIEPYVSKSFNRVLDREALEACKKMPRWTPGKKDGKVSVVHVTVPIKFCIN
ncbi:MAG: energy transducer TonB [Alloprevotella sp.]|nr:energy transducer TonB [Alloprevotella sp.]